jgi:hypothetical protein
MGDRVLDHRAEVGHRDGSGSLDEPEAHPGDRVERERAGAVAEPTPRARAFGRESERLPFARHGVVRSLRTAFTLSLTEEPGL